MNNIINVEYRMSLWLHKLFPTIRDVINHIF